MKEIQLTQGKVALVDDEDFEELIKYKWWLRGQKSKSKMTYYAMRSEWSPSERKTKHYLMHTMILGKREGFECDHIDRNGLNNTRANLRLVTRAENGRNREPWGTSKYVGVHWDKLANKWRASITINKLKVYIGLFKNEVEASEAFLEYRNTVL